MPPNLPAKAASETEFCDKVLNEFHARPLRLLFASTVTLMVAKPVGPHEHEDPWTVPRHDTTWHHDVPDCSYPLLLHPLQPICLSLCFSITTTGEKTTYNTCGGKYIGWVWRRKGLTRGR